MLRADGALIHACMARYGFNYVPPAFPTPQGGDNDDVANMARRYGLADMSTAATYGYHLPPSPDSGESSPPSAPMSQAENLVFIGDSPGSGNSAASLNYRGMKIPSDGCSGEAQRKMGSGMNDELAETLDDTSFHQSESNPQVIAAFKSWSSCMAGKGYTFSVPWQPAAGPGPSASQSEILMAEADVTCKARLEQAYQALCKVGLRHRANSLPTTMSGGERQRVAIARALVNSPDLVLCDEPTGNLDSVTASSVMDLLEELNATGVTLIVITHDAAVAGRAQRTVRIFDGHVAPVADQLQAGGAE